MLCRSIIMYFRFAFPITFAHKRPFLSQIIRLFSVFYTFLPTPPPRCEAPTPTPLVSKIFFLFFSGFALYIFVSFYECFYFWVFYFVLLVLPLFSIMVYLRQYFCASDGLCHRWSFEAVCGVFRALLVVLAVRLSVYVFLR